PEIGVAGEMAQRAQRLGGGLLHYRLPPQEGYGRVRAEPLVAWRALEQRMVPERHLFEHELPVRVEDHLAFAVDEEGRTRLAGAEALEVVREPAQRHLHSDHPPHSARAGHGNSEHEAGNGTSCGVRQDVDGPDGETRLERALQ